MERRQIIVRFGGHWEGSIYMGGNKELILMRSGMVSYKELMVKVDRIVRADLTNCQYELRSMIPIDESETVSMQIASDLELEHVLETWKIPEIFVTIEKTQRNDLDVNEIVENQSCYVNQVNNESFVQLMASQNAYGNQFGGYGVFPTGYGCNYMHYSFPSMEEQRRPCSIIQPNSTHSYVHQPSGTSVPYNEGVRQNLLDYNHEVDGHGDDANVDDGRSDDANYSDDTINDDDDDEEDDNDDDNDDDDSDYPDEEEEEEEHVDYDDDHDFLRDDDFFCNEDQDEGNNGVDDYVHQRSAFDDNTDNNFSDELAEGRRERSERNWNIPGASFHSDQPPSTAISFTSDDILQVGAIFTSKDDLITSLGMYALKHRFEYRVKRSTKSRYSIVCKQSGCAFLVSGVGMAGFWKIIKFVGDHSCDVDISRHGPRQLPSRIIGALYAPKLLDEGRMLKPKDMKDDLRREHGIDILYNKALKAKDYAHNLMFGDQVQSFQMLPSYLHVLRNYNPGTVIRLQTDEEDKFEYLFIAIGAAISGFRDCCRPVIVVDGTHLKGKYRGIMFVAATKDGNEQIFPLAFGIADKEKDNSWIWFLTELRNAFGCPEDLLIVSDRHKSIKNAVNAIYPGTTHGICTYHLQQNMKVFRSKVVSIYKHAAYVYLKKEFKVQMRKLKETNDAAYQKLRHVGIKRWARSYCPVRRYEFMTSNAAEVLNSRLRWARRLPICSLLECVRDLQQRWFYERRNAAASRNNDLTEWAARHVEEAQKAADHMQVLPTDNFIYSVRAGLKNQIVNLREKSCSCRRFDLDLIPCSHAIAAIRFAKQSISSYVADYYKMEKLRQLYSGLVMPLPHPEDWDVPYAVSSQVVKPPTAVRQAGRPRNRRILSGGERSQRRQQVCSRCMQPGHNRVNCNVVIPLGSANTSGSHEVNQPTRRQQRGPRRCSNCRQTGHTRRICPTRTHNNIVDEEE